MLCVNGVIVRDIFFQMKLADITECNLISAYTLFTPRREVRV